ncbi:MAG: dTDP-Rha:A-D-GlcNAc-diphosphoryl polyprenol, A-3-L-rhamnosyl transferase WbbL, partial [uncultured Solirubrobacterales bacterium]
DRGRDPRRAHSRRRSRRPAARDHHRLRRRRASARARLPELARAPSPATGRHGRLGGGQREHRRHRRGCAERLPLGAPRSPRLELGFLHRQQHRPARLDRSLRAPAQPRHRGPRGFARPHDRPHARAPRRRHGGLPARPARRALRSRRQALVPDAGERPRALHGARPARGSAARPRPVPRPRARRARDRRGRRRQRRLHARAPGRARGRRPARRAVLALHGGPRLVLPLQAGRLAGPLRREGERRPREGRHVGPRAPPRPPPEPEEHSGLPPLDGALLPEVLLRGQSGTRRGGVPGHRGEARDRHGAQPSRSGARAAGTQRLV